jgi:hypothetical protein
MLSLNQLRAKLENRPGNSSPTGSDSGASSRAGTPQPQVPSNGHAAATNGHADATKKKSAKSAKSPMDQAAAVFRQIVAVFFVLLTALWALLMSAGLQLKTLVFFRKSLRVPGGAVSSRKKQVAFTHAIPLSSISQYRKVKGGTLNDVLVTCVSGAIRRFLLEQDAPALLDDELLYGIPISVRPVGNWDLTNLVSMGWLYVPMKPLDPVKRMKAVQSGMSVIKASPEAKVRTHFPFFFSSLSPLLYQRRF